MFSGALWLLMWPTPLLARCIATASAGFCSRGKAPEDEQQETNNKQQRTTINQQQTTTEQTTTTTTTTTKTTMMTTTTSGLGPGPVA